LIIPAYNEGKYIGRTLESVRKAIESYNAPHEVEIIVVDNCSSDDTVSVARRYGAKVVTERERRIATVRNKGAKESKGEIIGFLDADSSVTPNILNSIDGAMSSGLYIGGGTDIKIDRASLGIYCTYLVTTIPARILLGIAGGLIFTARAAFEAIGGFDESLYCAEDSKFVLALKKYGKLQGKRFKVLTEDSVITSSRAFDKFGDWYYFKNLPRFIFRMDRMFRDRRFSETFWYYDAR